MCPGKPPVNTCLVTLEENHPAPRETTMVPILPTVADPHAQEVLNAAADVAGPPHLRVARAERRCNLAKILFGAKMITEEEYGRHEAFKVLCAAATVGALPGGDVPPAWFVPELAAAVAAGHAPMAEELGVIRAQLELLFVLLGNNQARAVNSIASEDDDSLHEIRNDEGIVAPQFPRTLGAFNTMNEGDVNAFLAHYDLALGPRDAAAKRLYIKRFIGIDSA